MLLKNSVIKKIGKNTDLQWEIARVLDITPYAVQVAMERGSKKTLTQYHAVKVISETLGIPMDDLFETKK